MLLLATILGSSLAASSWHLLVCRVLLLAYLAVITLCTCQGLSLNTTTFAFNTFNSSSSDISLLTFVNDSQVNGSSVLLDAEASNANPFAQYTCGQVLYSQLVQMGTSSNTTAPKRVASFNTSFTTDARLLPIQHNMVLTSRRDGIGRKISIRQRNTSINDRLPPGSCGLLLGCISFAA